MKHSTAMRRTFLALLACLVTVHGASAATVTIIVQADQRLGRIEPMFYGQFIEHLGRCINGGIFEPGSPLSDTNGFRRDVLEKVRELNPPLLRWQWPRTTALAAFASTGVLTPHASSEAMEKLSQLDGMTNAAAPAIAANFSSSGSMPK